MSSAALLEFFAYSTELEQESEERYSELADVMATHHNDEVATFFSRMAGDASNHLAEVTLLSSGEELPQIEAWEFDWPDAEPPESLSYEAVHYRMSLQQAMQLALANERAAEIFYRDYSRRSEDSEVRRIASEFADEEASHADALELLLQQVPEVSEIARIDDDDPVMPE
jgi:rubrerythrin